MMPLDYRIKKAERPEDFLKIAALAQKVWHKTYDSLIGETQVDYMLEQFQSIAAIERDIQNNHYEYLMAVQGDRLLGYCGVKPEPPDSVFLSKVYIDPDCQGMGIAKTLIFQFISKFSRLGYSRIHLTVNKGNQRAIAAYERLGFQKYGELVTPIGKGFVMDDDLMELKIL